jgi:hypothetical protein
MFSSLSGCIRRARCRQKAMDARRGAPAMAIPLPSAVNQKYRNIKRRLFPHGGVARRCHSPSYVASSRLALRKNPSVLFVPLFLIHDAGAATPQTRFLAATRRAGRYGRIAALRAACCGRHNGAARALHCNP